MLAVIVYLYLHANYTAYRYAHYEPHYLLLRNFAEIVLRAYTFIFFLVLAPGYLLLYMAVATVVFQIRRWAPRLFRWLWVVLGLRWRHG